MASYQGDNQGDPFLQGQNPKQRARPGGKGNEGDKGLLWGAIPLITVPWLMFIGVTTMYAFLNHHFPVVVGLVCIGLMVVSVLMTTLSARIDGRWYLMFGLLCFIATVSGMFAGWWNYHEYMMQYWAYDENREYTNVLPSEPAAAHADAGKMSFSQSARIDTTKAVGYKAGDVYCVAPIMDETQTSRVEYWAAGVNCCKQRADFQCDAAADPLARSAVVILDTNSWLPSNRDMYQKAVKEAEAAYDIVAAPAPLFVRWVDDPAQVQLDFWRAGVGTLIAGGGVYFILSFILGIASFMSSKRGAGQAQQ